MIVLPTATEIYLIGVVDRGVANQERIVFRPTEPINLLQFIICIGSRADGGSIMPFIDRVFWFPEMVIEPPSWVFVYTGPGQPQVTRLQPSGQTAYTFHWGMPYTAFGDLRTEPVVMGVGSIAVAAPLLEAQPRGQARAALPPGPKPQ